MYTCTVTVDKVCHTIGTIIMPGLSPNSCAVAKDDVCYADGMQYTRHTSITTL